ncbi:MAG: hypothetical protein LBV80_03870 [Deltaproteobacteria bacterium]|jgi:hypothetical protein|nr:hypothetical protein [Deltaproteobacteria bacterium]
MRHFLLLRFVPLLFCLAAVLPAQAGAQNSEIKRVSCGGYSFTLPEGYELRIVQTDSENFAEGLVLNDPFLDSEAEAATLICLRERKTEFSEYVLDAKQAVKLRISPRQAVSMNIMATQDIIRSGMAFKYSILEEQQANRREIRGIHYYVPVIEINGQNEEYHTLLFLKDFRKNGEYYSMEGYASAVNRTAELVLRSISLQTLSFQESASY